jgi:membrane associated rhomboid family serine protease/TPR repeat protein
VQLRASPLTLLVAIALAAIFALEVALSGPVKGPPGASIEVLIAFGGLSRDLVLQEGQWWRLVAAPFIHADIVHLMLNGAALLFAGFALEDLVGKVRWALIYSLGALVGGVFSLCVNGPSIVSIGASGSVMALLAALVVLASAVEDEVQRNGLQVTAARLLVPSLLPVVTRRTGGAVDVAAHVGGALAGALLALVLLPELKRRLVRSGTPDTAPHRPLTPALAPIVAALVLGTAAGLAFAVRDAPALLVLNGRGDVASWSTWLSRACEWRSADSCFLLGKALARGEGLTKDPDEAQRLLAPLCTARDGRACFELGLLAYERKDFVAAVTAWRTSCDLGDLPACRNQGVALSKSDDATQDATIRALFEKSCPDVPEACGDLAARLSQQEPQVAYERAAQGCAGKSGFSCWLQARFLARGEGVDTDLQMARARHEDACTLGEVRACNSLAIFLQRGWGGGVDLPRAAKLLDDACATGDATCCANFALSLWEGKGIEQDQARARTLFETSCAAGVDTGCDGLVRVVGEASVASVKSVFEAGCAAGSGSSCLLLGSVLENHEKDPAAADARYLEACERGLAEGCAWHADLLAAGRGVTIDLALARDFFRLACEGGVERACEE